MTLKKELQRIVNGDMLNNGSIYIYVLTYLLRTQYIFINIKHLQPSMQEKIIMGELVGGGLMMKTIITLSPKSTASLKTL